MKQVIFFIEPVWAYGTVHYELCKYLWSYGVNAQVLPWNLPHSFEELKATADLTDYIVTTPGVRKTFHSHLDKLIIVLHGRSDILELLSYFSQEEINRLAGLYGLSNFLVEESRLLGIARDVKKLSLGINYFNYYTPISESLKTLGYAGGGYNSTLRGDTTYVSLKRVYLIRAISSLTKKPVKFAQAYINHFVNMKGFYNSVDAVLVTSTNEGAGLPALEAAAAGRLVLSTPVGHWAEKCAGITLPIEERELVDKAVEQLLIYEDPFLYRHKCMQIQEHARSYDWSTVIHSWVEIFK
jgi:hypothetical protein